MSTYKPTEAMASAAKKALKIRDEQPDSNKGMTQVGLTRARQLISRELLSLDTVKRMHSFFSRHEVDKKGEGWGKDSKGYQAWLGWGGDAGQSWAKAIVEREAKAKNISVNELIADIDEALNADASKSIMDSLRKKAKDHNEDAKHKVTAEKLYKIFKRGVGAYKTNPQSVKPGVSGSTEWGHRRVNAWLIALESGKFKSGAFDTDLLPKGHPAKNSESDVLDYKQVNTGLSDMNKLLLQTNVSKSMISEEGAFFRIKKIPITVNDAVMNRVHYPQSENEKGMNSMVGKPLTIDHPIDDSGNFVSGREGKGLQNHYSGGVITRTYEFNNTWYADAEVEKKVLEVKSPVLFNRLSNKEDMPVSTGLLFTQNAQSGVNSKGEEYDKVAINQSYDHLAALTNERPAGGDDTVARFNAEDLTVVNVNSLMNEEEQVNGIINALKSAPKAVKDFFSSTLQKAITNSYNEQDNNISTNEEIMNREQLLQLFGLNADSSISDEELNSMAQNAMKEGMKAKGKKMSESENEDDEEDEDEMKKKNMYKKNSSDNPELKALQKQVNSLAGQLAGVQNAEKDALVNRLANSDCGLDKEDLAALEVNSLQKLEAKFLGQVNGQFPQGHINNSSSHELDTMEAPE